MCQRKSKGHFLRAVGEIGASNLNVAGDNCSKDIAQHTRCATDIVQGQFGDLGVKLHEHGKRLADAARGTEDSNLGKLWQRRHVSEAFNEPSHSDGMETHVTGSGRESPALDSGGEHDDCGLCGTKGCDDAGKRQELRKVVSLAKNDG